MRGLVLAERYRLEEPLGAGGFAEVYRARDCRSGATVAVKVLCADDAGQRARFRQEALLLAGFEHPGIVRALDYAVDGDGPPFLALEYVPGPSLRRLLQERAWASPPPAEALPAAPLLPPATVLYLGRALLDALAYLHARGVVHRDLKPENVLLAPDGPKLLDFGLARAARGSAVTATARFTVLGTPLYMAPEQALGLDVDGRADLYALGVVLYELLTGEWPYPAETLHAVMAGDSRLAAPPEPAPHPALPPALAPVLFRLLRLPPGHRYPDAAAVRADLEPLWLALAPAERQQASDALARAARRGAGPVALVHGTHQEPAAAACAVDGAGTAGPLIMPAAPQFAGDGARRPQRDRSWDGEAGLPLPSILAGLPAGVLRLLAARLGERRYAPGEVVLRQGEPGDAMYLVVRGRFAVERQRPDGSPQRLATVGPGDLFGELTLIDGAPRSATVRALTAGTTRVLARADLLAVLHEHPDVALAVMARLARMIRRLDQQLIAAAPAPRRRARQASARRD
ncbi:MAG TPA: serine/threonine-protein kinase [Chloroflexota bacterium]|nr:serine/threonine-protein kinase [Chloroflexota bacterium]